MHTGPCGDAEASSHGSFKVQGMFRFAIDRDRSYAWMVHGANSSGNQARITEQGLNVFNLQCGVFDANLIGACDYVWVANAQVNFALFGGDTLAGTKLEIGSFAFGGFDRELIEGRYDGAYYFNDILYR